MDSECAYNYKHQDDTDGENDMNALINLQGMIFRTEEAAKEHYGERYETALLEWVEIDEDGEVV